MEVRPASSRRRRAEMGGMRRVGFHVIKHCVECSCERRRFRKSGKNRAVSNFGVEHKRWPLGYLQQMKISSVSADPRFDHGRTRTFKQFFCIDIGRFRSNFGGDLPVAEPFSLA